MVDEELYLSPTRPAREGRPWVLANMVTTVDGAVTTAGRVGTLTSPADQRLLRLLRSLADVVLAGASTVRAERYGPVKLDAELRAARRARGQAEVPPIAVVTASLRLDPDSRFFTEAEARPIVVVPRVASDRARSLLGDRAEVIEAGDERVDVGATIKVLSDRGAAIVLSEGGPTLLSELVRADLLDELCLTLAPFLGGDPGNVIARPVAMPLRPLTLVHAVEDEGHVFLRYLTGSSENQRFGGEHAAPA